MEQIKFPRISIITSIFKSERFIEHFLNDVSRQTIFSDCEILLLNANSQENEEKYIIDFQKCFPKNVVYKKLDKTYSIYETWNMGIDLSNSEIVTNWNTDDRRTFDSLERQVEEFEKDDSIDICYGPTVTTYVENENTENCQSKEAFGCYEATLQTMLVNNSPHCLPMWKKNLHQRFGYFDTKYPIAADYEMWLRALVGGAKFKMIKSLVGSYYRNPTGMSSDPRNFERAMKEINEIRENYKKYESI